MEPSWPAGADQGDEVWRVDPTPAGLCGLDGLERHRYSGGTGAGPLATRTHVDRDTQLANDREFPMTNLQSV